MTAPSTLNAIAIDIAGHYGQTAKNLVATYRATSDRAVAALGGRYEQLVESRALPWLNSEIKARFISTEQRLVRSVTDSVARIAERADGVVDRISGSTVQGLEALRTQTAWAEEMMVVGAMRKINLPAAQLSLMIASRVDDASRRLSERAAGATEPSKAKARKATKAAGKRARRSARSA